VFIEIFYHREVWLERGAAGAKVEGPEGMPSAFESLRPRRWRVISVCSNLFHQEVWLERGAASANVEGPEVMPLAFESLRPRRWQGSKCLVSFFICCPRNVDRSWRWMRQSRESGS